mmetsp:Transcript_88683/g.255733  ORF Transcript_88683/g.255733 Transcript_88683/m.255733 type:complete len:263 (-) Transcript_88683:539-1327(-)
MSNSTANCKMLRGGVDLPRLAPMCPKISRWESCAKRMSTMGKLTDVPSSFTHGSKPSTVFNLAALTWLGGGKDLRNSSSACLRLPTNSEKMSNIRYFSSRYARRPLARPTKCHPDHAALPLGARRYALNTAFSRPGPAGPKRTTCRARTLIGTSSPSNTSGGVSKALLSMSSASVGGGGSPGSGTHKLTEPLIRGNRRWWGLSSLFERRGLRMRRQRGTRLRLLLRGGRLQLRLRLLGRGLPGEDSAESESEPKAERGNKDK